MSRFEVIDILNLNTLRLTAGKLNKTTAKKKGVKMNYTQTESLPKIELDFEPSGFEGFVVESIDQTFSKLGAKVKEAFYSSLEANYNLSKEDIPNRIEVFVNAVEQVFGISAPLLEIDVMKNLRQKVPSFIYVVRSQDLSFEDYLESLKRHIENF